MWVEKNGPTWRIRDLVAGKKVTVKPGFPTKTAAKKAMTVLESDKIKGEALVPGGGLTLLRDFAATWYPSYETGLKPSGRISCDGMLRLHILPELGHLALEDIDNLTVQGWCAKLLQGRPARDGYKVRPKLAPKSVRNNHGFLHTILGAAVSARLIRYNPCVDTKLPEAEDHEMRFLTHAEAARLLGHVPAHWLPLVSVLLGTGMRWGEAIGLRVKSVDLDRGTVRIDKQLQELPTTAEMVWVTVKSRFGRRSVRVPAYTLELIRPLAEGRDPEATLFTAVNGGYVRYRVFRRTWARTVKAARLDGLRIHDLRHTQAAWLLSAGKGLTGVQRRLGHKSITVTSDRYGHLLPETDDGILDVLDGALPIPAMPPVGKLLGEPAGTQRNPTEPNGTGMPAQAA